MPVRRGSSQISVHFTRRFWANALRSSTIVCKSVIRSSWFVPCGLEVVFGFLLGEVIEAFADPGPEGFDGSFGSLALPGTRRALITRQGMILEVRRKRLGLKGDGGRHG
jgi:hypothetical protein